MDDNQESLVKTLMSDLEHFKTAAQTLVSITRSKDLELIELKKQLKFYQDDIYSLNSELQHFRETKGE